MPRGGVEQWAVPAPDRHPLDMAFWGRVAQTVGDAPSCLRFFVPDGLAGEDDLPLREMHENMYRALEEEKLERIGRGFVLTERSTKRGVRYGIVAAVDLEAYTHVRGESSEIRPAQGTDPAVVSLRLAERRGAPLEFPHTVLFYRDKRNKLVKGLLQEDLEPLYDFDLMEGGGHLKGYYIDEDLAYFVADMLPSRSEPCLLAADGVEVLTAAKCFWEELKPILKAQELRSHPARFALVELVNLYSEAVELQPVHRLVHDVEAEALCDYFSRQVKCVRKGNLLYPSLSAAKAVAKTDAALAAFLRANGGKIEYVCSFDGRELLSDEVGIVLPAIEKEDLFPAMKDGKLLPAHTFLACKDSDARYCLEGREISYD